MNNDQSSEPRTEISRTVTAEDQPHSAESVPPAISAAPNFESSSDRMEDEAGQIIREIGELVKVKFSEATFDQIVTVSTNLVLIVIGIVAASIYWCQFNEMQRANDLTREALALNRSLMRSALAAYLVPEIGFAANGNSVNIGFANHGKTGTTNLAHYRISLIDLPTEKILRTVKEYTVTDSVPPAGEPNMPNHFYEIEGFSETDMDRYRDSSEAIQISGDYRYDDGFGETVSKEFCLATTNFQSMRCEGIRRYILSLAPRGR